VLLTTGLIGLSGLCILICAFKKGGKEFLLDEVFQLFLWMIKLQCFKVWMMFFGIIYLWGLL
jgi:hypothetical protein